MQRLEVSGSVRHIYASLDESEEWLRKDVEGGGHNIA